jgi:hypothetical protein
MQAWRGQPLLTSTLEYLETQLGLKGKSAVKSFKENQYQ